MTRTETTAAARKFVAPTSREALRLARESLGGAAMVLASRALPEGVEIVAMAEEAATALVEAAAPASPAPALPAAPAAAAGDAVLSELHSMRSMIEERLASVMWNDQQRRDPVRGRLLRTMLAAGFSARLSKAMLERLPAGHGYAEGEAFIKSELLRTLPVQDEEDALLAAGGVCALVGPTGVGKTTTTAKLAARCVMRFGADQLALVTTDSYRIGAYEQLRIYGQILNVKVYAVQDGASLQLVLHELRDKHMVLIDTVGMSQRDRSVSDQIAMLCGAGRPVKRLLLLNAASHGDTLNEVVYAYQRAGQGNELAGCIFTKLDEATSHGALLDTVIRHRLPVHYLSNGQKVPENLRAANRAQLVEDVLRPPPAGALFVAEPEPAPGAAPEARPAVAGAGAEAERLRRQYQQLIRAMAHDAQEVAAAADDLRAAGVGFAATRELQALATDPATGLEAMTRELLRLARGEVAAGCDRHVLAVDARVRLDPGEHGEALELHSTLLLSDRHGLPLAAPQQRLAAPHRANAAERQAGWLRGQDFGLPVVRLLPRPPAAGDLHAADATAWVARAAGSTVVTDPRSGDSLPLWRLALEFGPAHAVTFRGKEALQSQAETQVLRPDADGRPVALRCIVRRVLAAGTQRPLEQCFLLAHAGAEVSARQLADWHEWAARADACCRMTGKGLALMGSAIDPADPAALKRLLAAGQLAVTATRLLSLTGERAARTRVLLAELAGRQVRPDRPPSGNVLYEGLAKLIPLLEALATDAAGDAATAGGAA